MSKFRALISALHAFAPAERSERVNIWNYYKDTCFVTWDATFNSFTTRRIDESMPQAMFTIKYFANDGETPVQSKTPVSIWTTAGTALGMCKYRIQPIIPYKDYPCKYGWVFDRRREGGLYIRSESDLSMCLHADDGVIKVETCRNDRKGMAFLYGTQEMRQQALQMKNLMYKYGYDKKKVHGLQKIFADGDYLYNKSGSRCTTPECRKHERKEKYKRVCRTIRRRRKEPLNCRQWHVKKKRSWMYELYGIDGIDGLDDESDDISDTEYTDDEHDDNDGDNDGDEHSRQRRDARYKNSRNKTKHKSTHNGGIQELMEHIQMLGSSANMRDNRNSIHEESARAHRSRDTQSLDSTIDKLDNTFAHRRAFGFAPTEYADNGDGRDGRDGSAGRYDSVHRAHRADGIEGTQHAHRSTEHSGMHEHYNTHEYNDTHTYKRQDRDSALRFPYTPYTYYNMNGYNGPHGESNICPKPPKPKKEKKSWWSRLFGL